MEVYQLKTFVAVAREGTITRASEVLHVSQPAVSAHVKALEEALGLALFERTPRGMTLTEAGRRLLEKAERTLAVHEEMLEEAARIKGRVAGRLRIGASSNVSAATIGETLAELAARHPEVEVTVAQARSASIALGIRSGTYDAGFFAESGDSIEDVTTIEVASFGVLLAVQRGKGGAAPDWRALEELAWIYPGGRTCCALTAERVFADQRIRPSRVVSVDREAVTRDLVARGVGVGLLHADTAEEAERAGEVDLVYACPTPVRVLFGHLASRAGDPVLGAALDVVRARVTSPGRSPRR